MFSSNQNEVSLLDTRYSRLKTQDKNRNRMKDRLNKTEWQTPQITEIEITDQTQQLQPPEMPEQS